MENLKIYVIHYTPLKERKQFLLEEFNKHSLNFNFIEEYDREKLTAKELYIFDTTVVKLSMCSNITKHIYTYQKIIESNYLFNLILEDDIILDKMFINKLKKGLEQLPEDYDMLFIGDGCNLHIPSTEIILDKYIYLKSREPKSWGGNGGTRCTDSYLVSKKCAQKLMSYISKLNEGEIKMPSDWWLNQVIRDLKLEIYWMEPTIVSQGTQNGKYKSSH